MTKKYAAVYKPLVERLQAETEKEQKKKPDNIKAVKTKLHQLYGAYTQDNAHKKAAAIISALEERRKQDNPSTSERANVCPQYVNEAAVSLLPLHASTKERLPHYAGFYEFILSHTGPVESILDIGCGYNPFSIPLMAGAWAGRFDNEGQSPAAKLKTYHAYDIDTRVADLINRFLVCLSLPPLANCADLAVHVPPHRADIALMCKLIPVLEAQAPGSGFKLARELSARHLLITYPLKSLGGREKGMAKHYAAAFEKALNDGELGEYSCVGQKCIGNEMLYLLSRKKVYH
ncbi:MAG: hypothetical protein FWC77_05020 [Defluviitaleaceae bacterium]|nr:hypothetical protein [Defluviitaleaceae bacterium]